MARFTRLLWALPLATMATASNHGNLSNPTSQCPPRSQVQKAGIATDYNVTLHQGHFFELYFLDVVETACTCFSKVRTVTAASLHDADHIYCGLGPATMAWYNTTEQNFFVNR